MDLLAEETDTESVYGADKVVRVTRRNKLADPALHLLRRLVSEREAQDVCRVNTQFVDDVGVPVGERLGLSGPRSGHDPHPPFRRGHRLTLLYVQCS